MKDSDKRNQELLDELAGLRQRVSDLEASEAECRRTLKKLQVEAQIMQVSLDSLPVLLSYIDSDHRYRFANRSYERQFGVPVDEIPGKHMREVMGDALYQKIRHYVESALSGKETSYEIQTPRADGEPREMRVLFVPHFGRKQEVSGIAVLVTDVTAKSDSARQLEEAKDFSDKILRTSPVGIGAFNSEGQCVLANEAAGFHNWGDQGTGACAKLPANRILEVVRPSGCSRGGLVHRHRGSPNRSSAHDLRKRNLVRLPVQPIHLQG